MLTGTIARPIIASRDDDDVVMLVYIDQEYLHELVDAWANRHYDAGTYDARTHATIADLVLTCSQIDEDVRRLCVDAENADDDAVIRALELRRYTVANAAIIAMGQVRT